MSFYRRHSQRSRARWALEVRSAGVYSLSWGGVVSEKARVKRRRGLKVVENGEKLKLSSSELPASLLRNGYCYTPNSRDQKKIAFLL